MTYRSPPPDAPLLVFSTQVVALDRTTGAERWKYPMENVVRRFAIDGDRVFVFDSESCLHCLDVASGRLLGKIDLPIMTANSMLLDGDRLYVSGDNEVTALDRNGTLLWTARVPPNGSHSLCGLGVPGGAVIQPDFSKA